MQTAAFHFISGLCLLCLKFLNREFQTEILFKQKLFCVDLLNLWKSILNSRSDLVDRSFLYTATCMENIFGICVLEEKK